MIGQVEFLSSSARIAILSWVPGRLARRQKAQNLPESHDFSCIVSFSSIEYGDAITSIRQGPTVIELSDEGDPGVGEISFRKNPCLSTSATMLARCRAAR
jgi:hypothetical protein